MNVSSDSGLWLKRHRRPANSVRLVVYSIPPIGAGAGMHQGVASAVADDIDVLTLRLPGREKRRGEAALQSMEKCVDDLLSKVAGHAREHELPFVLLGDCATSLLAYELARALERSADAVPAAVIAVSCRAPRHADSLKSMRQATSDDLRTAVSRNGTVPLEITADPAVFALFEATVRADLAVYEGYRWDGTPLETVPIWALTPSQRLGSDEFAGWREATLAWTQLTPIGSTPEPPLELSSCLSQLRDALGVGSDGGVALAVRAHVVAAWVSFLPQSRGEDDEEFFDLGGDSIDAVRMSNALRQQLGYSPPLETILRGPTLGELVASAVESAEAGSGARVGPAGPAGHEPASGDRRYESETRQYGGFARPTT